MNIVMPIIAALIGGLIGVGFTLIVGYLERNDKGKVLEWLFYAVSEAEAFYGAGTGKLKLRYVYDLFLKAFPKIAARVEFDTFSNWVDEALNTFKEVLNTNEKIKKYIEK